MDLTVLMEYMSVCVVGICLCVGYIVKHMIPTEKVNRFIPLMMGGLGLVLNIWLHGHITAEVILGGLFSGLASTGLYEAFTNLITRSANDQIEITYDQIEMGDDEDA